MVGNPGIKNRIFENFDFNGVVGKIKFYYQDTPYEV